MPKSNLFEKVEGIYDIKTEEGRMLEAQPLYNIISTDARDSSVKIMFVDYRESTEEEKKDPNINSLSIDIFEQEVELKMELVEIKNDNMPDSVMDYLNKEFVQIVQKQSDKNRNSIDSPKNDEGNSKFDIDYNKILESSNGVSMQILRKIVAKLNNLSNWLAVTGRIGAGKYIISNSETNKFLLETTNSLMDNLFRFVVDDTVENGKIIMGRKNSFDQPGIILVLNENSLFDIVYNEEGKSFVNLIYAFSVNGFHPERQHFTIYLKK